MYCAHNIYVRIYVLLDSRVRKKVYTYVWYVLKRMQQFVKICAPLFDKKCDTLLRYCGAFFQTCRNLANAPHFHEGVRLLCCKCTIIRESVPSSLHLQGRRYTFTDYGALARKDAALSRKTAHFWDCGELGTIVARPSKCSAHGWRKAPHITSCFQVRVRRVCCILFDAYHIYERLSFDRVVYLIFCLS